MAQIVLGMAMAHGPTLSTPSAQWCQRAEADRRNPELFFQGRSYTFDELVEARRPEHLENQLDPQLMRQRYETVQTAIATLGSTLRDTQPDVAVIVGNDQQECFRWDNLFSFLVDWGDTISNAPLCSPDAPEETPGLRVSNWGYYTDEPVTYPGVPDLGRHVIQSLMDDGFDVAQSRSLPNNKRYGSQSSPHAFGFVYRRVMCDDVLPNVPILVNTFYPPNQPSMKRCFAFGQALGQAIRSWSSDKRVAVIASGGLSHFVIEEDLDRQLLDAVTTGDPELIGQLPTERFESGTSEMRNWVVAAGALAGEGLRCSLVDYVPCYRTVAGTGQAAGFCQWT